MNTLAYYRSNPTVALPFAVPDLLGLDATGRDGDDRFPYTWGNLTQAEQAQAADLFPPDRDVDQVAAEHDDEDDPAVDVSHYARRPTMPLPNLVLEAIGCTITTTPRTGLTWNMLTDAERDKVWELFPPVVAVAVLTTARFRFTAVAGSDHAARAALDAAWQKHAGETGADTGYLHDNADEISVVAGPSGSVWRDGSRYLKGNH